MIVPLTPPYFRAISEAHVVLDPTAFLSQNLKIGAAFREQIFYPLITEDPRSFVWIYLAQGVLAGYVAATENVEDFYRRLKGYRPFLLGSLIVKAALKNPGILIKYISSAIQLEQSFTTIPIRAEILSLGVLPRFRTPEFERNLRASVAQSLFDKTVGTFQVRGISQFKVMTLQENRAANRFYEKQGCRLVGTTQPFGMPCHVYVGDPSTLKAAVT